MNDDELTTDELVAETLARLPVAAAGDGDGFVGDAPDWFGPTLFGGFVLGQATNAITHAAPDGFALHSLHAYFLSAMRAGTAADYRVTALRDGRSFAHRRLDGTQQGRPFVTMMASFTPPGGPSDFEYGRRLSDDVPRPDQLDVVERGDPWRAAYLGPTPPEPDGFLTSSSRRWMRFARPLPDDVHLHASLLAYASDMTGQGARPLLMAENSDITGIVSLDHTLTVHRPVRVDQWLFYDLASTINTEGRGYLRGQIFTIDGDHVASVTQETLLWDPARGR